MGISGHLSSTSVRKYIANSKVQKENAAGLVSLMGTGENGPVLKKRFVSSTSNSSGGGQEPLAPIHINISLSGNAQMNGLQLFHKNI
jgi:hypothetical protein